MATDSQRRLQIDHVLLARLFAAALLTIGWGTWMLGFEVEEVHLIPCVITAISGYDCPGCGMTRASVSLVRGDFQRAWQFNPFVYLVVPLAIVLAVWPRRLKAAWDKLPTAAHYAILGVCLLALIGRWLTLAH